MNGVRVYPHVVGVNAMRAPAVNVAALAQQIAELPVQTLVELASAIVAVDAAQADRFADTLIDAAYDVRQAADAPLTSPDIDALADALLALDGMRQCDLAAALARRDPRVADSLSTTIGDAVAATMQPWCEQCNLPLEICRGHDLPPGMVIGGPALRLDAPLPPSERFAQNVLQRVADEDCRYQLEWTQ